MNLSIFLLIMIPLLFVICICFIGKASPKDILRNTKNEDLKNNIIDMEIINIFLNKNAAIICDIEGLITSCGIRPTGSKSGRSLYIKFNIVHDLKYLYFFKKRKKSEIEFLMDLGDIPEPHRARMIKLHDSYFQPWLIKDYEE